jgi:hypothetical protein
MTRMRVGDGSRSRSWGVVDEGTLDLRWNADEGLEPQVLGLAALVGAYPYDVPSWMPEILVQLVNPETLNHEHGTLDSLSAATRHGAALK